MKLERSKVMSKKGSLFDLVVIAVFVFAFSVSCLVGYVVLDQFNDFNDDENNTQLSERGGNITNNLQGTYGVLFDGLIVFLLAGLAVALIVSVMLIRTHPGFLWVSLFMLVIFGMIFFVLQETYVEFSEEQIFNTTNATNVFNVTQYVMENYLTIFIIIGLVAIIVMYAKFGSGWT